MKNAWPAAPLLLAGALLAAAWTGAADQASLEVRAATGKTTANVWIDQSYAGEAPVSQNLSAGVYRLRVCRRGCAIQRQVLLKQGCKVVIQADFEQNKIEVENIKELDYQPLMGKTEVLLTSTRVEPSPLHDYPEKGPAHLGPAPAEDPVKACPAGPEAAECRTRYGEGPRALVYLYYCLLVEKDFEGAYELRATSHDRAWFYRVSRPFCRVSGFRIKGLMLEERTADEYEARYEVRMEDREGKPAESWELDAVIVKRRGRWLIRELTGSVVREAGGREAGSP